MLADVVSSGTRVPAILGPSSQHLQICSSIMGGSFSELGSGEELQELEVVMARLNGQGSIW